MERTSSRYAELVYEGRWFSPLRRSLAAFYDELNKPITGVVRLQLYRGHIDVLGAKSPNSLYRPT
jgi:argininosuccinate synthase